MLLLVAALGVSPCVAARSVLLITIDTWRADHLGVNGSSVETPHLDRLAQEGVNFTRARTPVPLTLPAHASIFTGDYPPAHGVRDNGSFRLAEDKTTLAEVLRRHGYDTAAFVGSFVLDGRFGLGQGFDVYEDHVWSTVDDIEDLGSERSGTEVFDAFSAWLSARPGDKPFFAWIHLYDPHAPYEAPEPFRAAYPDNPYGAEVAFTDAVVGRILTLLQERRLLEEAVIAAVGDHGEGLGEHGEGTHSLLIYNSTLHVPMLLRAPGLIPAGQVVDELVRVIDLAPTVLDYLGIEQPLGEGSSLRLRVGDPSGVHDSLSAYSESLYPQLQLGWSPLRGLELEGSKLIVAPTPELYDLVADREELQNRATTDSARYQRLKKHLAGILAEFPDEGQLAAISIDSATRERLRSLGYVGAGGGGRGRPRLAIDPKDRMELWDRIQRGMAAFGAADYRLAVRTFGKVVQEDPDNVLAYEFLGSAWQKLSEPVRARQVYSRALERGLESAELHLQLGRMHAESGQLDTAARELEVALTLDPWSVEAHFEAGQIERRAGRLQPAVEHYRRALDLNPRYLWAWSGLGMALAGLGEIAAAEEALARVVEIDPEGPIGYFNLAVHLDRAGKPNEAVQAYERFLILASSADVADQKRKASEALRRLKN